MNKVYLIGRLVKNPEFKINEKGTKIDKFRLAISNRKNIKPVFINIICFDILAEQCQNWLQKGSKVFVDGRLDYQQTEKAEYYSVVAQGVQFLSNLKEKNKEEQEKVNVE